MLKELNKRIGYESEAYFIAEAMRDCYNDPEPEKPTEDTVEGDIDDPYPYDSALMKWQSDKWKYEQENETLFESTYAMNRHKRESQCFLDISLEFASEVGKHQSQHDPDASIQEYMNINATNYFRKHHMLPVYCRQPFIEQYWTDGKFCNRSESLSHDSKPVQQLLDLAGPYGEDRIRDLLKKGYFSTRNGRTSRTQTFVLSIARNLFIEVNAGFQLNTVRLSVVERNFEARVTRDDHNTVVHLGR